MAPHPYHQRDRARPDASGMLRLSEGLDSDLLEALRGLSEDSIQRLSDELGGWLRDRLSGEYRRLAQEFSAK